MNIKYLSSLNESGDKNKKTKRPKEREKILRVYYTKEQKQKAIESAIKIGAVETSTKLGIPYSTLKKWFNEKRTYNPRSEAFKNKVINRYKQLGAVTRVAKEFGVGASTLRYWIKKELICVTQ